MAIDASETARLLVQRATRARREREREAARVLDSVRRAVASSEGLDAGVSVWLIGSLAWGGFGPHSDVDLVVSGAGSEELTQLEARLAAHTGRAVDLLVYEDLPEGFRARIGAEGIRLRVA